MAYKDIDRDLGQHVAFAVNDKGTGRRGTVMPGLSKTETAAPERESNEVEHHGKQGSRAARPGKETQDPH